MHKYLMCVDSKTKYVMHFKKYKSMANMFQCFIKLSKNTKNAILIKKIATNGANTMVTIVLRVLHYRSHSSKYSPCLHLGYNTIEKS